MKKLNIVYLMYEASPSSYAESYFIPLIKGLLKDDNSILFLRLTEKNIEKEISIDRQTEHFALVNAPIGMFSLTNIRQVRQLSQNLFTNGKRTQNLVIARGIGTFWICLASGLLSKLNLKFVYDSDGLSADEAIEFRGSLKSRILYVPARIMEALFLLRANLVLTRSEATKSVLKRRMPLARGRHFIELNNGCDPGKYTQILYEEKFAAREALGLSSGDVVFVYLGSYGEQYEFEKMLLAFLEVEITGHEKKLLIFVPARDIPAVKHLVESHGIYSNTYVIRNIGHEETPFMLTAADFGFSLRQESFSMKHVKPLKTREYLFAGLSVIYSKFTGDAASFPSDIGFVLEGTEESDKVELNNWVQIRLDNQEYFYNRAKEFATVNLSIETDIALLSGAIDGLLGGESS